MFLKVMFLRRDPCWAKLHLSGHGKNVFAEISFLHKNLTYLTVSAIALEHFGIVRQPLY